jgi:branched-chain amino acid transport system permease protein
MGISVRRVLLVSFGLSAALGALAGVLIAPISFTSWDVGVMLGLKGFAAAILGGMGSGPGAVVGGLALGLLESLGAGYVSSAYKDAIAFVVMLAVLMLMPSGLLGRRAAERV